MLPRMTSLTLCLVALFSSRDAAGLEKAELEKLLKHEIIGPDLAMAEVQSFTEQRVPAMPAARSLDEWQKQAASIRRDVLAKVVFRGQAQAWRKLPTRVEWLDAIETDGDYRIRKLRYEAVPGMWCAGLLYEPTKLDGRVPVVLNVNGHDRNDGKAAKYKQIRCINQAKRGMIALNVEWIGMGQHNLPGNAHYCLNQLDLCGTSGLAPFYLAMKRGIDILLEHEHADPARLAVAGLSGGGWQTIFISSLDTRVKLANPVAGYSSFRTRARHLKDLGDSEQTPNDLATIADYTHLTALLAPRATLLTFNAKDNCCFEAPYALPPLLEAAEPIFKLYAKSDRLRSHVNHDPGTHNFEQDNRQALYRMFGDHFFAGDKDFDTAEISCEDELKTKDELAVALPDDNATLNSLALEFAKALPRDGRLPQNKSSIAAWQSKRRGRLADVVHLRPYECSGQAAELLERDGLKVTYWRLNVGDLWTVPVVELSPGNAKTTALVIGDGGRVASSATIERLLGEGRRVLAVDPFYFGESQIASRDFLFGLLVAAVGERPLGVQASQLIAISRWSQETHQAPVTLIADGPRTGTIALVASALETKIIAGVELYGARGSLKELIEKNETTRNMPEQFCFGLLEQFDILQLAALSAPRPVTFHDPTERVRKELKTLGAVYGLQGLAHKPLGSSYKLQH